MSTFSGSGRGRCKGGRRHSAVGDIGAAGSAGASAAGAAGNGTLGLDQLYTLSAKLLSCFIHMPSGSE